jgi:hypothetical protein
MFILYLNSVRYVHMVCTYHMYIWYVHIKRAKITVTCGPGDFVSCEMEKPLGLFREETVDVLIGLFLFVNEGVYWNQVPCLAPCAPIPFLATFFSQLYMQYVHINCTYEMHIQYVRIVSFYFALTLLVLGFFL